MPAGILRKTYECSLDTYPLGDVRGKQAIIHEFITDLVDLDIGWVIVSENIPTSNFHINKYLLQMLVEI